VDKLLAIDSGDVTGQVTGIDFVDPAFSLPSIWIDDDQKDHAQVYGYTVVDASTVAATFLNHLLHTHASELLGRKEVQDLLDKMSETDKQLVDEVTKLLSLTTIQNVLKALLDEEVSIRDMRSILEALLEHAAPQQTNWHELVAVVRIALRNAITQQWFDSSKEMHVICLNPDLERVLLQAVGNGGALEPNLAINVINQTRTVLETHELNGYPPVLLVEHQLRPLLSRALRRYIPHLCVMSNEEIPTVRDLKMVSEIGGDN
jgi:flagellar biosynthesis protein FlhA